VTITNSEVSHHAFFSSLLLFAVSSVQIFNLCFSFTVRDPDLHVYDATFQIMAFIV